MKLAASQNREILRILQEANVKAQRLEKENSELRAELQAVLRAEPRAEPRAGPRAGAGAHRRSVTTTWR